MRSKDAMNIGVTTSTLPASAEDQHAVDRPTCHQAVIVIVGFRNADDVTSCVSALSRASTVPEFDILICENGGREAYEEVSRSLLAPQGPCTAIAAKDAFLSLSSCDKFAEISCLRLASRSAQVLVARASGNLGFAGAINAWLTRILPVQGWEGVWILNPDTEPEPNALRSLVERARSGRKGMVGSTIVPFHDRHRIACRGGLQWRKLTTQPKVIGFADLVDAPAEPEQVEASMDSVSGASMYVTRSCIEQIGLMDERYFLYYEDLDWGLRAKGYGLGYASSSVVPHKLGTTIGSASSRAKRSALSVYLGSRNRIHFVRKHFPAHTVLSTLISVVDAVRYLAALAPGNSWAVLAGLAAGLRGETGPPPPQYAGKLRSNTAQPAAAPP